MPVDQESTTDEAPVGEQVSDQADDARDTKPAEQMEEQGSKLDAQTSFLKVVRRRRGPAKT